MNKYILYLLVAMTPSLTFADVNATKALDKAYMFALDKQYPQARDKAFPLLDNLQLSKIEDIVLAHQILSLAYCETGDREKSLKHLMALHAFSKNEDFRIFNPSVACKKLLMPAATPEDKNKKPRR